MKFFTQWREYNGGRLFIFRRRGLLTKFLGWWQRYEAFENYERKADAKLNKIAREFEKAYEERMELVKLKKEIQRSIHRSYDTEANHGPVSESNLKFFKPVMESEQDDHWHKFQAALRGKVSMADSLSGTGVRIKGMDADDIFEEDVTEAEYIPVDADENISVVGAHPVPIKRTNDNNRNKRKGQQGGNQN